MQPEMMKGTYSQIVGKLTVYIRPDGTLVAQTGNRTARLVVTADEALGLFDYLLRFARYFEQAASNGRTGTTEPLKLEERQRQ